MIRHFIGTRGLVGALLGGAVLGAVIAYPADAAAWWVRQHSSDCVRGNGTWVEISPANFGAGIGGAGNNYICPVPDNDRTAKTTINVANVEVSGSGWSAKACQADWNGATGDCSSAVGQSGTTISLGSGSTEWDTDLGADFGFVQITPGTSGRVSGIFYSN